MANTDWWGQASSPPQTAEQLYHAQQALKIERQWAEEARAVEEERKRRKKSAYSQLMIAAVAVVAGAGAWLFGVGAYQGIFYFVAFAFGYSGLRQLIRTI